MDYGFELLDTGTEIKSFVNGYGVVFWHMYTFSLI